LGPELEKYRKETDHHRDFVRLCAEVVGLNEKICDRRPVPEIEDPKELGELKKKLQGFFSKRLKRK
jgi:hypothetical protein